MYRDACFFMKVAIISNSDAFFTLAYTLGSQRLQVDLFYSPGADSFTDSKVAAFVKQVGVSFTEEKNADKDLYNWLHKGNYDICFIIGYKNLIDLSRIKNCPTRLFNIHFGPLPLYRGPMPVFWQLKHGEQKIGLCIHHLSQKFDDGPLVWLKEIDNLPHYNYQSVNQLFNNLCVEGVFYVLQLLMQKLPLPVIDRSAIKPAYQKRPGLDDVMINWQQMSAAEIANLIRACNPWNKGAISFFAGQEVKLLDAQVINSHFENAGQNTAGSIVYDDEHLHIYCADGCILSVNMLVYQDFFMPAYQCRNWGFIKGQKFG
jgi:methionyl-tRNA formyltransferase